MVTAIAWLRNCLLATWPTASVPSILYAAFGGLLPESWPTGRLPAPYVFNACLIFARAGVYSSLTFTGR